MEPKRLRKSALDRKICGVCGGIAEYFNIDPTIVRLLFVVFGFTSTGVIAYIIAAIIMPEN
ncbi:MAG: PspC domain-containing protein [bacterium]|nr:PspC domain-containing protein [bacterium]